MSDVKTFTVGGDGISVLDETARTNAATAVTNAQNNQLSIIGMYGGRDLSTLLAGEIASGKTVFDALHARNSNANYTGLLPGDYVSVKLLDTYSSVCTSQTIRFLLADVNPYYTSGDTQIGRYMVFVAQNPVAVASTVTGVQNTSYLQWNTTANNNGNADQPNPNLASNLKAWEESFLAVMPTELTPYLLNPRFLLETRYSASGSLTESGSWAWASLGKVFSLSEKEVWGCHEWSQPGYGGGIDRQLQLFRVCPGNVLNGSRCDWWLRSVVSGSSSDVCSVTNRGTAYRSSATHGWVRPRPCFLLG